VHTKGRRAVSLLFLMAGTSVHGQQIDVRYLFPERASIAETFTYFGGELGPVEGRIVSTRLNVGYIASGEVDAANYFVTFDVPTSDGASTVIVLTGTDLGWTGQGTFSFDLTSIDYNGTIRPGRFGAQFAGDGDLVDSYVEFTVDLGGVDHVFEDGFDSQ
jgi:hypothetical protein